MAVQPWDLLEPAEAEAARRLEGAIDAGLKSPYASPPYGMAYQQRVDDVGGPGCERLAVVVALAHKYRGWWPRLWGGPVLEDGKAKRKLLLEFAPRLAVEDWTTHAGVDEALR